MRKLSIRGAMVWAILLPAAAGGAGEPGDFLVPGEVRERTLASGEIHAYSVAASERALVAFVEQRGIDLVVEARSAAGSAAIVADAPNIQWGPEILVLPAGAAGGYRIEIRAGPLSVVAARYSIRIEELPGSSPQASRTAAALEQMSRAGQIPTGTADGRRRALSAYRDVLAAWRALGDRRFEAEALYALGVLEQGGRELRPAIADFERALALWRAGNDAPRVAATLHRMGLAHLALGEMDAARAALREALGSWQILKERFDEGNVRADLCAIEQTGGALAEALACYEETRALFHDLGDPRNEGRMLNNLGGLYDLRGEPNLALEYYGQALERRRALGDRRGEAQTLNNMAVVERALGNWQEALRVYDQVRQILAEFGEQGDLGQRAVLLSNIGFTYNSLGEPQRALTFLEEALALRRQIGDGLGEIVTLNNLGATWRRLGEPEQALALHRRALELAGSRDSPRLAALTRLRLAEVRLDAEEAQAARLALDDLEPALATLRRIGLRSSELQALGLRGRALALSGREQEALPVLSEVVAGRRALRDRAGEAEALYALATCERSLGRLADARSHAEAAVARIEELRTGFVSPDLRAAFLATQRRAYSLWIDLLRDRPAEAFEVSERARARSLLDGLDSAAAGTSIAAPSPAPAALIERRRALYRALSANADRQIQSGVADERAVELDRELEGLLAELDGVEAEIRRHDPEAAATRPPPAVLPEIPALLDPGTLLLEYSLGEERSFLWALATVDGAASLRSFVLPGRREIETLARRVQEELSTVESGGGADSAAAELARMLLAPVWSEAARFERLAIVPDAALHLVPFGALPVPVSGQGGDATPKPLLEEHEVVYLPSATTLISQRRRLALRPEAPRRAYVLADPVFSADDPRVAEAASAKGSAPAKEARDAVRQAGGLLPAFERLPGTRREAETIAGLAAAGEVRTALDFAASREAVLAEDLRSFRVVHFATHGVADTRNPVLTGLVLSLVDAAGRPREGFLGLSDIRQLDLAADLVVLSGCRTAFGKEVRGEGLMGLTRGFLSAGARRVVASLWQVQDRAAAELMARFYRGMWRNGLAPAAALREAQRSLRREPRYRDPYFWSGFVLQGDWR